MTQYKRYFLNIPGKISEMRSSWIERISSTKLAPNFHMKTKAKSLHHPPPHTMIVITTIIIIAMINLLRLANITLDKNEVCKNNQAQ